MSSTIEIIIPAREKDLGGFSVNRVLPVAQHRSVGPFIFFDHFGPAEFAPGKGMEVRPHPHINLATVSYLFEGMIWHRDSLGSDQMIEPGAVNWMTAGRGIVHSERTPFSLKDKTHRLHGIQLWVALPEEFEETAPQFSHHAKESLPEFKFEGMSFKLILGNAFGQQSPVKIHSDLFYMEITMPRGTRLSYPADPREVAAYVVEGALLADNQKVPKNSMVVEKKGGRFTLEALQDSRVMLLGGTSVGPRFLEWNFASSSKARLEEAKTQWLGGPRSEGSRFPPIPGDDREFIPFVSP